MANQYLTTWDLPIIRGRGLDDFLDIVDEDGDPATLAGYAARADFREGDPSDPPGTLVVSLSDANGKLILNAGGVVGRLQFNMPAGDADLFAAGGNYWFDIKLTPPVGQVQGIPDTGPARAVVYEKITP